MQLRPGPRLRAAEVLRDILAKDGIRGVFRGQVALLWRGFFGGGVYFGGNAAAAEFLRHYWPANSAMGASRNAMLAGGVAGFVYWFPAMPFDTLKTRMMAMPDGERPPRYAGTADCARKLYAEAGVRGFYRGFQVALLRAVPANAAAFTAFDVVMRSLTA